MNAVKSLSDWETDQALAILGMVITENPWYYKKFQYAAQN